MRQANIYYQDNLAGVLTETDEGDFVFRYEVNDVKEHPNDFIPYPMCPIEKKDCFPFLKD